MKNRTHALLCMTALAGLATQAAMAQPTMVYVGPLTPTDMTPGGDIVIGSSNRGPAVWRLNGGSPTFSYAAGAVTSSSPRCSEDGAYLTGLILNTAGVGGLGTDRQLSARWAVDTGWQNLGIFEGATACDATINTPYNISADGRFVVGGGWINCKFRAYSWDATTGVMTNLGVQNANRSSRANCVSSDGGVVAGFDENPNTGTRRPAAWVGGVEQILETTGNPTTEGGEVYVMNNAGTILVGSSFQYPNQLVQWTGSAGSWSQQSLGGIPEIPAWVYNFFTNPQIQSLSATAMTQDGQVIVGQISYTEPGSFPTAGAFIYTPATGLIDLTTYLSGLGTIGLSDFGRAGSATAISANGRIIAGTTLGGGNWILNLDGAPCLAPTAWIDNSLSTVNANSTAIFNCMAMGSTSLQFQWRCNGVALVNGSGPNGSSYTGATTSQLRVLHAQCDNVGQYDCIVTNSCGTATTPAMSLTVNGCPTSCYANCDGSTTAPILNVNDFICFQQKFAAGDSYANCDGSTTAPVLNVNDFICFQGQFVGGCL